MTIKKLGMAFVVLGAVAITSMTAAAQDADGLTPLGVYDSGLGEGAAEIAAFDPQTDRIFVTNGGEQGGGSLVSVDIVDISDPNSPSLVSRVDLSGEGSSIQSVAVGDGQVAAAVSGADDADDGVVVLMDTDGNIQETFTVGNLPDMVAFTPGGDRIVVANEGEPICDGDALDVDPEGSISIIDIAAGTVTDAGFGAFDADGLRANGVRVFFPGSTAAQDLEPEYVAVDDAGTTAFVTLQENNALAVVDIASGQVTGVVPLGYKDHGIDGNGIDPSNRDDPADPGESGVPNIRTVDVLGMFQPDTIDVHDVGRTTYLFTANEGDARDYDCYSEEIRVGDFDNDTEVGGVVPQGLAVPPYTDDDIEPQTLGRLRTTSAFPTELDGNDQVPQVYAYGARSFTIWDTSGSIVFDSGDEFEQFLSDTEFFNTDDGELDGRSDDKGPEPEAIAVGTIDDRTFAFIGLERSGGIMMYDVSDPANAEFVTYVNTETDVSPESIDFVAAAESPNGEPLLVVAHEISGTTRIFQVDTVGAPETTTTTVADTAVPPTTVPATTTIAAELPATGSGTGPGLAIAVGLLALGSIALIGSRRRTL